MIQEFLMRESLNGGNLKIRILTDKYNKEKMGTLSGEATPFSDSHLSWGQLLKERICSHWSKFFHLRVDLISKGLLHREKHTGSKKFASLYKNGKKCWRCSLSS